MYDDRLHSRPWTEALVSTLQQARRSLGLLEPPDPRPQLPARRPTDALDRVTPPAAAVLAVVALALAIVGVTWSALVALALVIACVLLITRRVTRAVSWHESRRQHRRRYLEGLADHYDRYRVEVDRRGGEVRVRLQVYRPGVVALFAAARLGLQAPPRAAKPRYRVETIKEHTFTPEQEIEALERAAELQAEAEEREERAREAYLERLDGFERASASERAERAAADDLADLLREQVRAQQQRAHYDR